MSRLSKLLDEPERKVAKIISKLEDLSGYKSEDVRLLADINLLLKEKIASLGLDPSDTTGEELYEALKVKLNGDLSHLERAWGLDGKSDTQKIIQVLDEVSSKEEVLAIKCASIKRLLKISPPKKTMKLLGYRSHDSMMKREDSRHVLAIALQNESNLWVSKLTHKISSLKSNDYEFRTVKFIASKYSGDVYLTHLAAAVCLSEKENNSPVSLALKALQAESVLGSESQYLSKNQFSKDFGLYAQRLFMNHPISAVEIAGENFMNPHDLAQVEQPKQAHMEFANLHPALYWWKDTGHLALAEEKPVSLHISDCLANLLNKNNYKDRVAHHFSAVLKNQLISRYCNYETVKNYILGPIDDTFIALDSISAKKLAPEFEEIYN